MRSVILGAIVLVSAAWVQGQPLSGDAARQPIVRATGESAISVQPDLAKIDIGVVTQAATAAAAAAQNAAQLQTVLDRLRSALGAKADIRTVNYSLNPNYQYPREGGKPTITGYSAVNTVQVTTDDLANLGKTIDAATRAGANAVQRLQFTLKNEKAARAQALRQAAQEARSNAEAMAAALGLKLGKVIAVEQGEHEPIRPIMEMAATLRAADTPVQPGTIEVRASVTLTISLE